MATHSSTLVWRIPWTEKPLGYSPRGLKESDTTERLTHNMREKNVFYISNKNTAIPNVSLWDGKKGNRYFQRAIRGTRSLHRSHLIT